jgi:hypothetical protein
MLGRNGGRRRAPRHAFRPSIDGNLEVRVLLSQLPPSFFLKHTQSGLAFKANNPKFRNGTHAIPFPVAGKVRGVNVATEVAHGGQSTVVTTTDGSHFILQLTQFTPSTATTTSTTATSSEIQGVTPGVTNVTQPQGTIRAYPMSDGRVGIIVDGSTSQTELDISPFPQHQRKGYAHSFSYGQTNLTHILNIGQITVNSGVIGAINGFHTAELSGPLTITGNNIVDRISFEALLPGASITTASDLNTLDILNTVNLSGAGTGINVGRDLNLFNAGGDVTVTNGASIHVGRFLGLTPQPAKGTSTGANFLATTQSLVGTGTSTIVPSLSAYIQGNLTIGDGSVFTVVNGIPNTSVPTIGGATTAAPSVLLVNGTLNTSSGTFSQLAIVGLDSLNTGTTLTNAFLGPSFVNSVVARGGSNIAGFGTNPPSFV